jgi:hypothetical protein
MTIQEVTSIITTCVAVAGLVGLFLTWYNIRGVRLWNKLNSAFTFLPNPLELETVEGELDRAIGFWHNDTPLDDQTIRALMGDLRDDEYEKFRTKKSDGTPTETLLECRERMISLGRKLKLYVNQIEMYCAGVNSGVVDNEVAFYIYNFKFQRHHDKLAQYIEYIRHRKGSKAIFFEFDSVVRKWSASEKLKKRY